MIKRVHNQGAHDQEDSLSRAHDQFTNMNS